MATNIEIKARLASVDRILPRVAQISDGGRVDLSQDDTFFVCDEGRLKLRSFGPGDGELIFYKRENVLGPKPSYYLRSSTSDPDGLRDALALAYGSVGRVRKHRTVYMIGNTRIHLDRVEGLGHFLELEVVLDSSQSQENGVEIAERILRQLDIPEADLTAESYIDLIRRKEVRSDKDNRNRKVTVLIGQKIRRGLFRRENKRNRPTKIENDSIR